MLDWLKNASTSSKWAAYKHYITFGAGFIAAIGLITATQQQDLLKGVGDFMAGLQQMLAGLVTIATFVVGAMNAWKAAHNASASVSIQRVQDQAADKSQPAAAMDAKAALLTATATLPEVKEVKLEPTAPATPALAATTPPNVVAAPQ